MKLKFPDKQRLDFIEKYTEIRIDYRRRKGWQITYACDELGCEETLRDAIDVAIRYFRYTPNHMSDTRKFPSLPMIARCPSCEWLGGTHECLYDKHWNSLCCPQCRSDVRILRNDVEMNDMPSDYFETTETAIKIENPDPFVIQFQNNSKISFYNDGRVVGEFQNPDDTAKQFLKFVDKYYSNHIIEAEARGAAEERERCAKLIEDHCERYITERGDSRKELAPRMEGDLAGLTYAEGIRNLGGTP